MPGGRVFPGWKRYSIHSNRNQLLIFIPSKIKCISQGSGEFGNTQQTRKSFDSRPSYEFPGGAWLKWRSKNVYCTKPSPEPLTVASSTRRLLCRRCSRRTAGGCGDYSHHAWGKHFAFQNDQSKAFPYQELWKGQELGMSFLVHQLERWNLWSSWDAITRVTVIPLYTNSCIDIVRRLNTIDVPAYVTWWGEI